MAIVWVLEEGTDPEILGFLPGMISDADPRPAREQFDAHYQHGGGWRPQPKFTMVNGQLHYPGDLPMRPLAWTDLRDEMIVLYQYGYVAIINLADGGSFEVCRMD